MLFNIIGKHIEITEAIRKHAQDKTEKLPHYYDSINQVDVHIESASGGKSTVEIIARAEHNKVFVAREAGEDVYACIDAAVHKIEGQLRKQKAKERDNKHTGG